MNYIQKLKQENESLKGDLEFVQNWMYDLERYVLSPKFHLDTTVQVGDILLRLNECALGLLNPVNRSN